jgi:hypothetical protein
MAASPNATDSQDKWGPVDGQGDTMGPSGSVEAENGAPLPPDAGQGSENPEFTRDSSVGGVSGGSKGDASYREKQVKVLRVFSSLGVFEWSLSCAVDLFSVSFSRFTLYGLARLVSTALAPAFLFLCSFPLYLDWVFTFCCLAKQSLCWWSSGTYTSRGPPKLFWKNRKHCQH